MKVELCRHAQHHPDRDLPQAESAPAARFTDAAPEPAGYHGAMDEMLDTTGLSCPLPVLKARKRLKAAMP